ncbi:MAG: hypothetical protein GU361_05115 [Desulfurococcales archaeon]|jgi:hypothetical protein|nr:hypothetical protein [Desulfurococcales archaeon]
MLTEKVPLSYEVTDKGELTLTNISNQKIMIWSIEVWFSAHVTSLITESSYLKKRIRDVIVVKKELAPSENFQIDIGVSKRDIIEIKIHYSIFGKFEILHIIP